MILFRSLPFISFNLEVRLQLDCLFICCQKPGVRHGHVTVFQGPALLPLIQCVWQLGVMQTSRRLPQQQRAELLRYVSACSVLRSASQAAGLLASVHTLMPR